MLFHLPIQRKNCVEDKIQPYCSESLKNKLKDVCRTRWFERIKSMDIFEELFVPVYYSFLVKKEIMIPSITIMKLEPKQSHCINLLMILNSLSPWL